MRRFPNDEQITRRATELSVALSDLFLESSGKGLVKYVRDSLAALDACSLVWRRRGESSAPAVFEVTGESGKALVAEPPSEYKAVMECMSRLQRVAVALDPEGVLVCTRTRANAAASPLCPPPCLLQW